MIRLLRLTARTLVFHASNAGWNPFHSAKLYLKGCKTLTSNQKYGTIPIQRRECMINVLFAGYDEVHGPDFCFEVPKGYDCYLFVLTNTPAEIKVNAQMQQVPAKTAILFEPQKEICYQACEKTYGNDWIRFTTDASFVVDFPVKGQPITISDSEYYHQLVRLITWESATTGQNSEMILTNLFRILFAKLLEDTRIRSQSQGVYEISLLRREIYNFPSMPWSVHNMSKRVHMSEGYLQRVYRQSFGTSCMDDVIESRIRMAKDYLHFTQKSIAQVAEDCGYSNVEHFCHQFRKRCKMSPGEYRKTIHEIPTLGNHEHQTVIERRSE